MPYVSRDKEGNLTGAYANKQPGFGEEWLEEDNPEYVEWLEASNPDNIASQPTPQDEVLFDHENRLRAMEGQPPLTMEDMQAKKRKA